jgi:hypothetical protein
VTRVAILANGASQRASQILAPCHCLRRAGIKPVSQLLQQIIAPFCVSASIDQFGGADEASPSLRIVNPQVHRDSAPHHQYPIIPSGLLYAKSPAQTT